MEGDAVAPEGAAGLEQPCADRARQLLGAAPAGGADLVRVERVQLLGLSPCREHEGAPVDDAAVAAEGRLRADEEPLELDVDAELLARLPLDAALKALVRAHTTAGRAPGAGRVRRLLDQREPAARVEDEDRHVVAPLG